MNVDNAHPGPTEAEFGLPGAAQHLALAEERLGIAFHDRRLLLQALLHRSYVLERERDGQQAPALASNERLEFLGDAVLSMLIAQYAFHRFPDFDEGRLTEVRSALVRRSTLAVLAEGLDLSSFVYMGRAERRKGGRGRLTVLAEAFEAVVAAIFLDQGSATAAAFLERQLSDRVDELLARAGDLNAKSRLQEFAQATLHVIPHYALIGRHGPAHDSRFDVRAWAGDHSAVGNGTSRQAAEQDAARELLRHLTTLQNPAAVDGNMPVDPPAEDRP